MTRLASALPQRSRLLALAPVVAVLLLLGPALACHELPSAPLVQPSDIDAGRWRTWLLADGAELRPGAPPAATSAEGASELETIVLQQSRTAATDSARRWSASPTAPWDSVALRTLDFYFPLLPDVRIATPARAARVMALLHVAMYDALVATWDAKYAYRRLSPTAADPRVRALVDVGGVPSYPSEHAAAAAAAAAVLSAVFPGEDTLALQVLARAAGDARIAAGVAYPSDIRAGSAIGRAVAARAIARAAGDGSSVVWTGSTPVGDGLWKPTPNKYVQRPFDANAGEWRTWVISAGNALRPPPPPARGSAAFGRDLAELRSLSTARTLGQTEIARYWATDAPSVIWEKDMLHEIAARQLTSVRAARAQALNSVAMYDAFVACWDAKFSYWVARPVTTDSAVRTVFPTPPFPSYPSGHSTISSAAAEVFADLFPDAAQRYRDRATEASLSRIYAGVHYRFDVETGDTLGVHVGAAVVQRARADGAPR